MNKLLLIVLFAFLALSFAQKCPAVKPEAGKCKCNPKVKFVCGASGKTHVNRCVAKCFGDVVAYSGKCFKKCAVTNTTERKCSMIPFGKFGIRKYCCTNNNRCFGKTCSKSNFQCNFNGPIIATFPKRSCKWTKRGKDNVMKCCTWTRKCVGEVCKNSKKKCQFKGPIIRKSVKKSCQWKKSPTCGDGVQKYCCRHSRKCILGGKCTKPKKLSCKFVGKVVRTKITRSCKWIKVGKHGKRRQCCSTVSKCKGTNCSKGKKQCKWIGWVYVSKQIKKCATRKVGKATRKRCCVWNIKCYNKKCTTTSKSCGWEGAAVKITSGKSCKLAPRGKGKKQMKCCSFKKRCVNAKCKTFAKKCKWTGKVVRATSVTKCALVFVAKAKASRKQCCSFDRICKKKCVLKNKKCTFTGPFIQTKLMKKCQWKKINKVASCNFCCEWQHGCVGKNCQSTKKICRCATTPVYRSRKQECSMKQKSKNVVQKYCCDFKQTCFAGVGKSCKAAKKRCVWVGFPVVTKTSEFCKFKTNKGTKQQFCCTTTRKCQAGKCSKVKTCKWTGKVVVNIKRRKCSFKKRFGNSKQKFCCSWIEQCDGPRCKKLKKSCGYTGAIYQVYKLNYKIKKACGRAGKGKRTFRCTKKKVCVNTQPKTCDPNVSKCLQCKETKPRCKAVGKCTTVSFKVNVSTRSRGKGVKQQWRCVSKTVCRNNVCKRVNKKCGFVGIAVQKNTRISCTWKKDIKNKKERKFCCKEKTQCTGKVCKQTGKVCAFTGPWRAFKRHVVCRYVPFRTVKKNNCSTTLLRKQCCHYNKKCINNKCILQSKKCKFLNIIERTPMKKCSWKVTSAKKCNTFKQKVCTTWTKVCKRNSKNSKKVCKKEGLKIVAIKNATVRVTCKRTCGLKFFGDCQKRRKCCTKQTVCYGDKCHSFIKKCVWKGQPTKCCRGTVIFRWRTVCREQNFRKTQTREQCCRVYQRCEKITNYYRCSVVKKRGCWWTGAARGDVHLLGNDGKWHTLNVAGTFRYLADVKNKLAVFLQFSQVGSGSETSAIAIQADTTLVQAFNGKILINGKETTTFPAAVGKGQLIQQGNVYVLKGFTNERVAFIRQEDKSYTVDVGIKVGKAIKFQGLIDDIANPIKYQLTQGQSKTLFTASIPFKKIVALKKLTQAQAASCCAPVKVLDAKRFEQCVSDSVASGKCYAKTYIKSNEQVKEALTKK